MSDQTINVGERLTKSEGNTPIMGSRNSKSPIYDLHVTESKSHPHSKSVCRYGTGISVVFVLDVKTSHVTSG